MYELLHDLRQSVRMIRKRPSFVGAIILSIALGVGANTAIFSIANMLMLRPLPFPDDTELMRVHCFIHRPGQEPQRVSLSEFNLAALQDQSTVFKNVSGWLYTSYNLVGGDEPLQVYGARTTANALSVMGVKPMIGRFFSPEEDQTNAAANVVVLSHVLWQNHFGSDPDIVGRTLKVNDEPYTVIGVMPPLFEYPYKSKLWIPMGLDPTNSRRHWLHVVARLNEGINREQAMKEVDVIAARLEQQHPDTHTGWKFGLMSLREDLTRDLQPKKVVFMLMAGAGFLLLIACANVANMLLSHSFEQSGEIAIRAALGVSRMRLLRQLVTQGVVLALLGGAIGLLLAYWIVGPMSALHPSEDLNVIFLQIKLDQRVLAFTFLVSVAVGVLFSLIPALKMSRPNLQSLLMEGSRTTPSRSGRRLQKLVVIAEVAIAVILLVGSGLMLRSLQRLRSIDAGFDTENLVVLRLTPSEARFRDYNQQLAYINEIEERVKAIPGVVSASTISLYPHRTMVVMNRALPEGWAEDDPEHVLITNNRVVGPGLIETMKIPLLKGRTFSQQDQEESEIVVVVSETLAKNAWPDEDPLDRRIKITNVPGVELPWMRVIGVVKDVIDNGEIPNTWYLVNTQFARPTDYLDLVVRTANDPMVVLPTIREAIWSINSEQALSNVMTGGAMLTGEFWEERTSTFLLGMFAAVGLLLTIIGIYGIQSYSVLQQTHEMGVRMVFGAQPKDVVRATLRQGMLLSLVGLAIGVAGALILTRFLTSMLHEVSPTDPLVFIFISVITLILALIANYLPARRATRVNPIDIIRY